MALAAVPHGPDGLAETKENYPTQGHAPFPGQSTTNSWSSWYRDPTPRPQLRTIPKGHSRPRAPSTVDRHLVVATLWLSFASSQPSVLPFCRRCSSPEQSPNQRPACQLLPQRRTGSSCKVLKNRVKILNAIHLSPPSLAFFMSGYKKTQQ